MGKNLIYNGAISENFWISTRLDFKCNLHTNSKYDDKICDSESSEKKFKKLIILTFRGHLTKWVERVKLKSWEIVISYLKFWQIFQF